MLAPTALIGVPAGAATLRAPDDWLPMFAIENYTRHDTLGDALAAAQLALAPCPLPRLRAESAQRHLRVPPLPGSGYREPART